MRFATRLLALGALCLLPFAAPASAQYMYLDSNGDGVNTAADVMNANGVPTVVNAYLYTNQNADGSTATCDTQDGILTINSWVVNTHAANGTVTYSNYVNFDPVTFPSANRGFITNDHDMSVGQISPNANAPGFYHLMTMTVTGATGAPSLGIAEFTDNSPDPASFGTQCSGQNFINTYEYLVDWFDAGNLGPAAGGNAIPQLTVPGTANGTEGTPLTTITATATDTDGADVLTISQTGMPPDLTFTHTPSASPATATITGTPGFADQGGHTINWSVTDGKDTATGTTNLTIANTDRPPAVTAPANQSGSENTLLTFQVTAADPDGEGISSFTAAPLPGGATFTPDAPKTTGTFSWTPSFTQSGAYDVTFTAQNLLQGTATTHIDIANTDRPPTVTAPATATVNENALLTVNVTANDPDVEAITSLTASGTAVTAGATFAAGAGNTTGTLSWTPSFTQAGTYAATFTATNALSGSAATNITVNNVDRAPTVTAPPSATGAEGAALTVNVTAADPDGDAITSLTASGTAITAGATFTAGAGNTSGTLSWMPTTGQAGSYSATFTAANALTGSATTDITITSGDLPPVVTAPATATVDENALLTVNVTANDPDVEAITSLTASGTAVTAGATFAAGAGNTTGTLTWTPTFTQAGTYAATFTATNALSGSATTNITVNNVDHAPTVTAPATATVFENALLTVNVTANDPDSDPITSLTASGTAVTAGATFAAGAGNTTGTLSWTPTFTQAGTYAATFTATNALSGSATTNITVNNVERAPTVTAPATASGPENALLTFTVTAADADGDAITSLTAAGTAITAGATFTAGAGNTSGTFNWTPTTGQSGSYGVTFTASNALSGSAATAINIGADNAPVVTAPATATVNENALLTVNVTANDPDGDAITSLAASGTAITAGATFAANGSNTSGTLTWTPTFTQAGSYSATFTATNALSGSAATDITVNNVDRAPVVTAPSTQTVGTGSNLNFTVSASDADGDAIASLTAAGTAITAGATFTAGAGNTSGTFDWTPGAGDAGSYSVTFTASNALSGSAATDITVTGVNHDPVVIAPATQSTNEGVLLTFGVSATDQDGDHVTLTATGLPTGAGFTDNGNDTGTFSWTPAFDQANLYTVTFHGSDGNGGTGAASTDITVHDVNRAPTADAGGPYQGVINLAVAFDGSGSSDPDGDALAFAWDFGDGSTGTGALASHAYAAIGSYTVVLTVTDPGLLTGTAQTTADIVDVFEATAFLVGGNKTTRLGAGKPTTCVQIQPTPGSFQVTDVDLTSIVMRYAGNEISAGAKSAFDGDRNHDGIEEISACFTKEDLRTLFADLPGGANDVDVVIAGNLVTGGAFQAPLQMHVIAKGGPVAVSVAPNPLNPVTDISFSVERAGRVRVQVFDLAGRLVTTLSDQARDAGYYSVRWNGDDRNGSRVASGIYYVRVLGQGGQVVMPVTVLK